MLSIENLDPKILGQRRIASEYEIALTSTPELIQRWVDATSLSEATVAEVLKKIELFAKFRPRRADPLFGWWTGLRDKGE